MSDLLPDQPADDPPVQRLELGARDDDNARLAASLKAKAERINGDSGGWAATEWLGLLTQPCKWSCKKLGKGIRWAVKRFTDHEKRLAEASKARNEGKAVLIKAEADAKLTEAKARTENAKARQEEANAQALELKNETTAELLRQLRERGIDLAAADRGGQLDVAVVKQQPAQLPAAPPKRPRKKSARKAKQTDTPPAE
jgi:hypothetical protein